MMKLRPAAVAVSVLAVLSGCVTHPMGPTVMVWPAQGKSQAAFQDDVYACRQFADQQTAGQEQQANNTALGTAALGTLLGAGLGAAIGGGRGAAIGAGAGALGGTAVGANNSAYAQYTIQQRYDMAYAQCMTTHGNQVAAGSPPGYYPPGYYPPGYYPPPPPPPPR